MMLLLALAVNLDADPVDSQVTALARILEPVTDLRALSTDTIGAGCPRVKEDETSLAIERAQAPSLICGLRDGAAPKRCVR